MFLIHAMTIDLQIGTHYLKPDVKNTIYEMQAAM